MLLQEQSMGKASFEKCQITSMHWLLNSVDPIESKLSGKFKLQKRRGAFKDKKIGEATR